MNIKNKTQYQEIKTLDLLKGLSILDIKDNQDYVNIKVKWIPWYKIPKVIVIDENFTEGIAYYIGDGRTKTNRGLSIVDVDASIIQFFVDWLQKYFKAEKDNIKIIDKGNYKEARINSTILKRLFDKIKPLVTDSCKNNKKLASAYLRGIFAAESSIKHNIPSSSRSIHLKMMDKKEIKFIKLLLDYLNIKSNIVYSKSDNGWIIIISSIYELEKLREINLFRFAQNKKNQFEVVMSSYKRKQTKKGYVADFYLKKLDELQKIEDNITAPRFAKYIKRHRTRAINVLRQLEKEGFLEGKRIKRTGRPFIFQIAEKGRNSFNNLSKRL